MNGYYGRTSTTYSDGVYVYFSENEDGQNIYFKNNGVNNYFYVQINGSYTNFKYDTSVPDSPWYYDTSTEQMVYNDSGTNYTIGNYGTYYSFAAGDLSRITKKTMFAPSAEVFSSLFY